MDLWFLRDLPRAWNVLGVVIPLLGILAGAVLAHVRKERGWYLLSIVCAARLVTALAQRLLLTVFFAMLGMALRWF